MTPRGESGSVTAEFAVTLPAVLLVLVLCIGAGSVSVQRIEAQSAAAAAARMVARGEGRGQVTDAVGRLAPGASVRVQRRGDFVCADVSSEARFVAARSLGARVTGRACALSGSDAP